MRHDKVEYCIGHNLSFLSTEAKFMFLYGCFLLQGFYHVNLDALIFDLQELFLCGAHLCGCPPIDFNIYQSNREVNSFLFKDLGIFNRYYVISSHCKAPFTIFTIKLGGCVEY
jgi:hypothetical protein